MVFSSMAIRYPFVNQYHISVAMYCPREVVDSVFAEGNSLGVQKEKSACVSAGTWSNQSMSLICNRVLY